MVHNLTTMPKLKKQKLMSAAQKKQALNVYAPVIRSRRNSLLLLDSQLMRDAFIPNESCIWELTSNCRVVECGGGDL